jgi:hypothetical protein
MPVDSNAARRDSLMNVVLERIKGHEQQPAESVFQDMQIMKNVPAGRIPRIMNGGFGRSLGVGCEHCHVVGQWASNEKPQKEIARAMMRMVSAINQQYLAKIPNLRDSGAVVNCSTCHRGVIRPPPNPVGAR